MEPSTEHEIEGAPVEERHQDLVGDLALDRVGIAHFTRHEASDAPERQKRHRVQQGTLHERAQGRQVAMASESAMP